MFETEESGTRLIELHCLRGEAGESRAAPGVSVKARIFVIERGGRAPEQRRGQVHAKAGRHERGGERSQYARATVREPVAGHWKMVLGERDLSPQRVGLR